MKKQNMGQVPDALAEFKQKSGYDRLTVEQRLQATSEWLARLARVPKNRHSRLSSLRALREGRRR